jgi:rare lipoprotein A
VINIASDLVDSYTVMRIRVYLLLCILSLLVGATLFADKLYEQEGLASWYGGKFQGRRTANGEIFDTAEFTAAHKTLAFGTIVKVTNLENGKSTVVRINDRGPFIAGRIIDLSRAAAVAIELAGRGVARVRIEELSPDCPEAVALMTNRKAILYTIQIAAFRNREYAQASLQRLHDEGFSGFIEQTTGGIYRVMINDVAEGELEYTKQRLRQLGWSEVVARQQG